LKIVTDRSQLVNQKLQANQAFHRYRQEFDSDDFLVLVLRTAEDDSVTGLPSLPTREQRRHMKSVAEAWAAKLRMRPDLFPKVYDRIDWSKMGSLALLYLPLENVEDAAQVAKNYATDLRDWAASPKLETLFARINQFTKSGELIADPQRTALALDAIEQMLVWMREQLQSAQNKTNGIDQQENLLELLSIDGFDGEGFFFSHDGRLLTVFAGVARDQNKQNQFAEPMEFAQRSLHEAIAQIPDATIDAGLAGMPALEYEELRTTQRDFARSTIIALILVTLLCMWGFRSVARPALAGICLALAIAITFNFVWLTIGHLNLLALVFTVILVSIGIDFAIHFVTHYESALTGGLSPAQAIAQTYRGISSPLWMGGITSGAAFLSAYFTEFSGLSELGLITGGGLLICFICMFVIYPAMLYLLDSRRPQITKTRGSDFSERLLTREIFTKAKRPVLNKSILAAAIALVVLSFVFGQYSFDTNLLNLQAEDGNINRWQRLLLEVDDRSTFAISTYPDRESLENVRAQFDARSDLVRRTESLFPNHEAEKRRTLGEAYEVLSTIEFSPASEVSLFNLKREVWNFRSSLRRLRASNLQAQTALADLDRQVDSFYRTITDLDEPRAQQKLQQLQQEIYQHAVSTFKKVTASMQPPRFTLDRIPDMMRERFLGNQGSLALIVYPAKNTWQRDNLNGFAERARKIEPNLFGEIVALYENGRSLVRSFLHAATYSLIIIFALIFLWSRSLRATALTMMPLIASTGLLIGFMKWGIDPLPWNFANFFGLPILIGIGVDSGIHIVHAWRSHRVSTLFAAGKAVLFSSATTLIGFGILSTSDHLGVGSLGYILFCGIAFCLITSLTLLPIALKQLLKPEFTDAKN
jgi:hypothetical protein